MYKHAHWGEVWIITRITLKQWRVTKPDPGVNTNAWNSLPNLWWKHVTYLFWAVILKLEVLRINIAQTLTCIVLSSKMFFLSRNYLPLTPGHKYFTLCSCVCNRRQQSRPPFKGTRVLTDRWTGCTKHSKLTTTAIRANGPWRATNDVIYMPARLLLGRRRRLQCQATDVCKHSRILMTVTETWRHLCSLRSEIITNEVLPFHALKPKPRTSDAYPP